MASSKCVLVAALTLQPGSAQTNTWQLPSATGTPPSERESHSAVWAESLQGMLIFGGKANGGTFLSDLHLYLTQTMEWQQPSETGTPPSTRSRHSAAWAESLQTMLIFGGLAAGNSILNDLHLYLAQTTEWQQPSPTGTPPSERSAHSAVWAESLQGMLIFGGRAAGNSDLNDLHLYLAQTMEWQQRSPTGTLPAGRSAHSAVWAESLQAMLIFGGVAGFSELNDLHLYLAQTSEWQQPSTTGTPPATRYAHSAVWTESLQGMLIFGGFDGNSRFNDLHLYLAQTKAWQELTPSGTAPTIRFRHSAVQSPQGMVIFGGSTGTYGSRANDLHLYLPEVITSTTSVTSTMTTLTTSTVTMSTVTTSTVTTRTVTTRTVTTRTGTMTTMTLTSTSTVVSSTSSTTSVVEVPGCVEVTFTGSNVRAMVAAVRKAVAKAAGVSEDMVQVVASRGSVCARVGDGRRLQAAEQSTDFAMTFVILFPSSMAEAATESQNKLDMISREQVAAVLAEEVAQEPSLATSEVSVNSDIITGSVEAVNATTAIEGADSGEDLDGGRIVAIVVGALVLLCCVGVMAFFAYKKCHGHKEDAVATQDAATKPEETEEATAGEQGFQRSDIEV